MLPYLTPLAPHEHENRGNFLQTTSGMSLVNAHFLRLRGGELSFYSLSISSLTPYQAQNLEVSPQYAKAPRGNRTSWESN